MNKIYNWAILGCGKIANKFAADLKLLPNAKLYATASRDLTRAEEFSNKWGFEIAYGSYVDMVNDPKVDAVYIATPHSFHYEQTLLCLNHKKAVLCEKAFALNLHEVNEMVACAQENNTFLMEAFWTMFQPSFNKALEIVRSGELGKLKMVRSDFAFNAPFIEEKRLYNPKLGGGSLLDIGIYPVFAALTALGVPDLIKTQAEFSPTGSEESINIIFKYKSGEMASLTSSFAMHSPVQTDFCCENGYVTLHPRWFTPTDITIWKAGQDPQIIANEHKIGSGHHYEAQHVMECLDAGLIESPQMSWSQSKNLMGILDRIRIDSGIFFSGYDSNLFF